MLGYFVMMLLYINWSPLKNVLMMICIKNCSSPYPYSNYHHIVGIFRDTEMRCSWECGWSESSSWVFFLTVWDQQLQSFCDDMVMVMIQMRMARIKWREPVRISRNDTITALEQQCDTTLARDTLGWDTKIHHRTMLWFIHDATISPGEIKRRGVNVRVVTWESSSGSYQRDNPRPERWDTDGKENQGVLSPHSCSHTFVNGLLSFIKNLNGENTR